MCARLWSLSTSVLWQRDLTTGPVATTESRLSGHIWHNEYQKVMNEYLYYLNTGFKIYMCVCVCILYIHTQYTYIHIYTYRVYFLVFCRDSKHDQTMFDNGSSIIPQKILSLLQWRVNNLHHQHRPVFQSSSYASSIYGKFTMHSLLWPPSAKCITWIGRNSFYRKIVSWRLHMLLAAVRDPLSSLQ